MTVGAERSSPRLRLTELLASVSLATDLATGQPPGHALRTCVLSVALAHELGIGPDDVRTVHQFALLRFLGCTSDAAETAVLTGGDDRGFNAAMAPSVMGSGRELLTRFASSVDSPARARRTSSTWWARGVQPRPANQAAKGEGRTGPAPSIASNIESAPATVLRSARRGQP